MTNSRETSTKMTEQNFSSIGEKSIYAIENGLIRKDHLPNHEDVFIEGYEEQYLHKFKTYLGSVIRVTSYGRYRRNT